MSKNDKSTGKAKNVNSSDNKIQTLNSLKCYKNAKTRNKKIKSEV